MTDRILIVDPDLRYRDRLARELRDSGVDCRVASDIEKARAIVGHTSFDLLVCDATGDSARSRSPERVFGSAASGKIVRLVSDKKRTVRKAPRSEDYLAKVEDPAHLAKAIRTLLERDGRGRKRRRLKRTLRHPKAAPEMLLGEGSKTNQILDMVDCAADSKCTILITGESGTGKEVLAQAIHVNTPATAKRRFVAVNCAAIPDHLLESELFGHLKGAFTGAVADKEGLFEAAKGGTIFLDEIGEMSLGLQARLLRVLQEKEVRRVGSVKAKPVDARVICSTNRELDAMVRDGKFRDDLYYRINVLEIHLPPLRERREEFPAFINHFIRRFNDAYGFACPGVDEEAMAALTAHEWRGNIRELSNVIERALLVGRGGTIRRDHLPPRIRNAGRSPSMAGTLEEALKQFERDHIHRTLERCDGRKPEAAKRLGISLSTLYRRMRQLDIGDGGESDRS